MLRLSWVTPANATQVIDFDAVVTEHYEMTSEVAEHAVERGAAIADHVRPQAEMVSFDAWVTNTPVVAATYGMNGALLATRALDVQIGTNKASVSTLQATQPFDRVRAIDTALSALRNQGQVMDVLTRLRSVKGCVITSYKLERASETGHVLALTLDLKRVRIANTQQVTVPAERRAQHTQHRGQQPPEPPPPPLRSLGARVIRNIVGLHD